MKNLNLDYLEQELERAKSKKKKVKGSGFSKQKQIIEENKFYSRKKKK
ncbi:MAG: hypothetical protein WCV92_02090 [Candidatus Buchananbacteria bacterium]